MFSNRFELALERVTASDWERFEQLSSKFLAGEWPEIRSTASPSGDLGRDAELFSPEGEPTVLIQYSVAQDWKTKVKQTLKRIGENFDNVQIVVYVTNQTIGAKGDGVTKLAREEHSVSLDIRDRRWLVERCQADDFRTQAAEEFCQVFADPYLRQISGRGKPKRLSDLEAGSAITFLELQREDDVRDKNLSRLAYESFVRAALQNTDSDNRISRHELYDRVCKFVASHPREIVVSHVDKALNRLSKELVKTHKTGPAPDKDEFCLSFEEAQRIKDRLAERELLELNVVRIISEQISEHVDPETDLEEAAVFVKRIVEEYLLKRGEQFAQQVQEGRIRDVQSQSLRDIIIQIIGKTNKNPLGLDLDQFTWLVDHILQLEEENFHKHLKNISDTYTLFVFVREVPDVQSAVSKLFGRGDVWIDASVALPLIGELAKDQSESLGVMNSIFRAATEAGIQFHITEGIIEEVERHMNLCLSYLQHTGYKWSGRIPFLLNAYMNSGRGVGGFGTWLEGFRGPNQPERDISEFLAEEFQIYTTKLDDEADKIDDEMRRQIFEYWFKTHQKRRAKDNAQFDDNLTHQLARHDTECFAGVIGRRQSESQSDGLGYNSWWLTLDRQAYRLPDEILGRNVPAPVMTPDFLATYVALGPPRSRVSRENQAALPLISSGEIFVEMPSELAEIAVSIREENKDRPERVIRRMVRDAVDQAKMRRGKLAKMPIEEIVELNGLDELQ